jgi:zinc transporter, ZIP family
MSIKKNVNQEKTIKKSSQHSRKKTIVIAIIPLLALSGMIIFLFGPGQALLNTGTSLPSITIERIEFHKGEIISLIRNTGPETIDIAQADVNDRITAAAIEPGKTLARFAEAKIIIPFSWEPGVPYEIGVTTSDGTRFSKGIDAAALAPTPDIQQASFFAVLGTYVGVIPVLIGLLWYPFIKRLSANKYNFFLSLTTGLLVFLGIDALVEANEIAGENVAKAFNGQVLIAMVTIVSFLSLLYISEKLVERASVRKHLHPANQSAATATTPTSTSTLLPAAMPHSVSEKEMMAKPIAISLMISIGIGLHNLGEGLAIGAAVLLGQVAFSTFLIVGFTLHNTTEGLAIVAPMAKTGKVKIRKLLVMGLIAGAPAIIGTWIGGFMYSPYAAIIFLAVGAGAIFQVVFSIASMMAKNNSNNKINKINIENGIENNENDRKPSILSTSVIAGFIIGMVIMYVTSLLIAS